jgi:hypothetical protein
MQGSRWSKEAVMRALRIGWLSAAGTLLGIFLSGPLTVALVNLTHPQPPWENAALFARSFHPIQQVPYLGGIVLVGAIVVLIASLHALADEAHRPLTGAALIFTGVFATLIFFNYVAQTSFLPVLAKDFAPENAGAITALSMANPKSLAWGIEMWGWGFLGVATWLVAGVFHGSRLEHATAIAFIANGPLSIIGAVWTVAQPGWVMTPVGLVMFALWNGLLAVMAVLALVTLRRRGNHPEPLPKGVGALAQGIASGPEHFAH